MSAGYCSLCGNFSPTIHIHHKIPRSAGGNDNPSNLISLCPSCHSLVHAVATNPTLPIPPQVDKNVLRELVEIIRKHPPLPFHTLQLKIPDPVWNKIKILALSENTTPTNWVKKLIEREIKKI